MNEIIRFGKHFLMILGLVVLAVSCKYDNEEDLYGDKKTDCDTAQVLYSAHIAPLMQTYCNSCHNAGNPSGGINTSTHAALQPVALNGSLYGSVAHQSPYSPMPQGMPKLSDCNLAKIRKWVDQGAPNN